MKLQIINKLILNINLFVSDTKLCDFFYDEISMKYVAVLQVYAYG